MCQDQTSIQNDYIEQRDRCREYSQLKLDMAMRTSGQHNNDQNRRAMLVKLFGECMGQNAWNVSDNKPDKDTGKPKTPEEAAAAATAAAEERAALSRASECAFARQSANVSSLAATRAKACDLECSQRLKLAPDAPRPAACPSDIGANGDTSVERNE